LEVGISDIPLAYYVSYTCSKYTFLLISILDQVNNYDSPLKWGQLC